MTDVTCLLVQGGTGGALTETPHGSRRAQHPPLKLVLTAWNPAGLVTCSIYRLEQLYTHTAYNIAQHHQFIGGWVMFRGGMSLEGATHLYVLVRKKRVSLAAVRYQDEIIWVPSGAWQRLWYVAGVCQHFLDDEYMMISTDPPVPQV